MKEITKQEAKHFLVNYQLLNGNLKSDKKEGVLEVFDQIKTIQYDPLNVVGRNPDLVLQSRIKNYKANYLDELLYKDRLLIDGWDKMMSIYSISDWPYFNLLRNIKDESVQNSLKYRNSTEALQHTENVLSILKKSGPMLSTKIDLGSVTKGSWGHGKIAGAALDYLFHIGRVGVQKKRGTQKVYDLIENLIPQKLLDSDPIQDMHEFYCWLLLRRIQSIGFFWNTNSIVWDGIDTNFKDKCFRKNIIATLLDQGLLNEVKIENKVFYSAVNIPIEGDLEFDDKIRFLSPLDNILWDRKFIAEIFNFNYTWEVYTPKEKRKYGYYVLPLLFKGNFIGRIEPVFYKKDKILCIKNIWFEKNTKVNSTLKSNLKRSIKNFSNYLGAISIINESDQNII
ncbi:MAG: winged helix-turn-helix domain-containing protein [Bacteroidales bacterium]|nr:winged helix-turn-helix domain-containing protein [Bacteroidales bacterium]